MSRAAAAFAPRAGRRFAPASRARRCDGETRTAGCPVAASDEERLGGKRFDALEPAELAQIYRLMTRIRLATPMRRTRRAERARRGEHIDLRRTLRGALRTGGDPIRLAHRRRRVVPRRLVLLCDISGSMEPYARAYLQFLTAPRADAEAFVFATRLTRITRALATRSPSARSSAPPPPRRTGRAARASATRCAPSTTATAAAAWPAAR